ncbi:hypothetical protein M3P05_06050 [Sansalvadorimonas sp. 2012CJ34-2]|uniref:Uncharacterized protein n=1 Tax=Parendozoicomonas callyspongiae TaxID=2942213 RepID=A0ABT0PDQ8_9GAMM|nr:hypothetical protein [Sansalvadorimonas sp. 2012CJ34-2]MCL6269502.1 hypothetical protein [Sansalvadorimonas sp. 2012CJ34-2]
MDAPQTLPPTPGSSLSAGGATPAPSVTRSSPSVHTVPGRRHSPSNPYPSRRTDIPRTATPVEPNSGSLLGEQKALEAQLERVLNLQWVTNDMGKFIKCLNNAEFARKMGVQISICTEGTNGRFVCIAPPDQDVSAEKLKKFKNTVKTVLEKQKAEYAKTPLNFDHQIQAIGKQMQKLAEKGNNQQFNFNNELQQAKVKARSFEWHDLQLKVKVTMYQAGKEESSQHLQDDHEKKLREQQLLQKEYEMRLREQQLLQEEYERTHAEQLRTERKKKKEPIMGPHTVYQHELYE